MPAVSSFPGTLPMAAGAIGPGIHGMPLHGLVHPQAVTMGLPMAGATAVGAMAASAVPIGGPLEGPRRRHRGGRGAMAASAAQGLMMHPGGIQTAMGIVRAPPMMAGIAGTQAPPLPPGTPFGHPMMRPPMGGNPGKANDTLSFFRGIQTDFASLPSQPPTYLF